MFELRDCTQVGYVKAAHGLRGEIYIKLNLLEMPWAEHWTELWLERDGQKKVLSLKKWRPHKDGVIAVVKESSDRNAAEALRGFGVWLSNSVLTSDEDDTVYLRELLGFAVWDGEVEVGPIQGFSSNTAQDLLVVESANGPVEIPYVDDFLVRVDMVGRKVLMQLPEGLLDL